MMSYADRYRAARAAQLDRKEAKAFRRTGPEWAYIEANGLREMQALVARGWEVVLQDPSLRGLARRQYLLRKAS
jgi:hypothetical protein